MSSASLDDDLKVDDILEGGGVARIKIWHFTEPNPLFNYRGEIIARGVVQLIIIEIPVQQEKQSRTKADFSQTDCQKCGFLKLFIYWNQIELHNVNGYAIVEIPVSSQINTEFDL